MYVLKKYLFVASSIFSPVHFGNRDFFGGFMAFLRLFSSFLMQFSSFFLFPDSKPLTPTEIFGAYNPKRCILKAFSPVFCVIFRPSPPPTPLIYLYIFINFFQVTPDPSNPNSELRASAHINVLGKKTTNDISYFFILFLGSKLTYEPGCPSLT